MICSDKCQKIFNETWTNKKLNCDCGKKVLNPTTWKDDYDNKVVKPICRGCLYSK